MYESVEYMSMSRFVEKHHNEMKLILKSKTYRFNFDYLTYLKQIIEAHSRSGIYHYRSDEYSFIQSEIKD